MVEERLHSTDDRRPLIFQGWADYKPSPPAPTEVLALLPVKEVLPYSVQVTLHRPLIPLVVISVFT